MMSRNDVNILFLAGLFAAFATFFSLASYDGDAIDCANLRSAFECEKLRLRVIEPELWLRLEKDKP